MDENMLRPDEPFIGGVVIGTDGRCILIKHGRTYYEVYASNGEQLTVHTLGDIKCKPSR